MRNIRLRLLSYGVIAYMLLAFMWWSVLLYRKNREAFFAKADLMKIALIADGIITQDAQIMQHPDYIEMEAYYKRQEWMIMGEGVVFVITLFIGIWLINQGYNKEVKSAQDRRNFLLSITHELKSPIASIRLVLDTFLKRELKPEQTKRLTTNALKETERLNNLVNDLLLSAKLDTSYQPNKEPLLLDDLLRELIEKLRQKYDYAQFSFEQSDEIPAILADQMGMTSVALNLLENAVKYTPENPKIAMALTNENNHLLLTVADNGMGISDKEKKRIFDRFYRIGSEDTRQTKGTGLGLHIVKQIVEAHGGKIKVMDNVPKGTIFKVTLPLENTKK